MRLVLVDMPWSSIDMPSLALGVLKRRVLDVFPDAEVTVVHANIDFVDWLVARTGFTPKEYEFCANSYFSGLSEWIFSAALNDRPRWQVPEFAARLAGKVSDDVLTRTRELHELAPLFVRETAARIIAAGPDIVGFTTMFAQNAATLATARAVKELDPRVTTVLGGANCDGPQGAALHRNFPYVDAVVRGEGEAAFPKLLAALTDPGATDTGTVLAGIAGLCWRTPDGTSVVNPMEARPLPPGALVPPDFGDYYERHARSVAGSWAEPRLVLEGSRGCWWGEKHHCTFCGLNGSFMTFRSKDPGRFVDELLALVERHRILNVWVTDNILDMAYLGSVAPRLAESGYDLRIGYEIKSNLRREQLATLRAAGVSHVQPGIENLSSRVLGLMDKGVTGCLNVRLLRDAETVGTNVSWNYLYGFPGEGDDDYAGVIDQLPALHHLVPPAGATRVKVERFSPYYERPELGFGPPRPAAHYRHIYDLPETELADLVYIFDAPRRGITDPCLDRLRRAVDDWADAYESSRLTHCDLGERIVLVDTRPGFDWHVLDIADPFEVTVFRLLDTPRSPAALVRKAGEAHEGVTAARIDGLLARWRALGVVFEEGGHAIHVAPAGANQDLMRLRRGPAGPRGTLVPALATGECADDR
ncbi:RiPP maturation radical SAM C-methyltransferase [Streptomyces yaizuensis]|uniref:RiPP maturation radical SAM C-methyltransferase n=1 Tax=Streptomyces yaizuensis TaxID=2989713 RepID=A0ABQ5NX28_9ACTN|nr:RiPP maturation radical SAM C-methyltransferase [Streptomyces sp. YSPA8]GLF94916.1 RiPP maturation radical SAM C-methyltransferase [Streptomyces sp. YSPA8]